MNGRREKDGKGERKSGRREKDGEGERKSGRRERERESGIERGRERVSITIRGQKEDFFFFKF